MSRYWNVLPMESESKPLGKQTKRKLNRCEQFRKKRSTVVFIIPLPSVASIWVTLGDKWGSQPTGFEKGPKGHPACVSRVGQSTLSLPTRASCRAVGSCLRRLPPDGGLLPQAKPAA